MTRPLAAALLLAAAVLPAACKRDNAAGTAAPGEVLPGSASDAMLPIDRVTSQPPLDPRSERTGGPARDKDQRGTATAAATDSAAEPAAEGTGAAD